jgi:hypothetical protein
MDLPDVFNQYNVEFGKQSGTNSLVKTQNGNPFLSLNESNKGKVYFLSVPFQSSFSNFSNHSLFVTSLLRAAESSGVSQQLAVNTESNSIRIKKEVIQSNEIRILNQSKTIDFIPETQVSGGEIELFFDQNLKETGSFSILSDNEIVYSFGVNHHRVESKFDRYQEADLSKRYTENWTSVTSVVNSAATSKNVLELQSKSKLWKLFLLLALLFFALEIALIKLLK